MQLKNISSLEFLKQSQTRGRDQGKGKGQQWKKPTNEGSPTGEPSVSGGDLIVFKSNWKVTWD